MIKLIALVKKLLQKRFVKFLLVGALNTIFGYSIFALFIYFGFHYSIALILSTILGILFNFKTVGSLVFNSNNDSLIIRFFGVYAVVYAVNLAGLTASNYLLISNYVAGAILVIPVSLISYFLMKTFVFRTDPKAVAEQK